MTVILPIDLLAPAGEVLRRAADTVCSGGLIVYPTETVYGLGADALSNDAVRRVAAAKGRGGKKPILVIVHSRGAMEPLVKGISQAAESLMAAFWPGPVTLVFRAGKVLPEGITGGTGTVGIRIPSSVVCRRLVEMVGGPVTSTSANVSGRTVPGTVAEIEAALGPRVDLFLDGGALPPGPPSSVVDVSTDPPVLLREGALPAHRLRSVVPALVGPFPKGEPERG
jgi:L-threonylcarbamoyladenylate synthase